MDGCCDKPATQAQAAVAMQAHLSVAGLLERFGEDEVERKLLDRRQHSILFLSNKLEQSHFRANVTIMMRLNYSLSGRFREKAGLRSQIRVIQNGLS